MRLATACLLATLVLLAACGSQELVVLMPEEGGKTGAVTVTTKEGTTTLTEARSSTEVSRADAEPSPPKKMEPAEIEKTFGKALAARPPAPMRFILHFKSDSTELTKASQELLPKVLEAIKQQKSVDITVVGHADRAGDEAYNVMISAKRAAVVRKLLVGIGVDPAHIESTSHGEKYPLVPTADGVHEPKNRRVEVVIR